MNSTTTLVLPCPDNPFTSNGPPCWAKAFAVISLPIVISFFVYTAIQLRRDLRTNHMFWAQVRLCDGDTEEEVIAGYKDRTGGRDFGSDWADLLAEREKARKEGRGLADGTKRWQEKVRLEEMLKEMEIVGEKESWEGEAGWEVRMEVMLEEMMSEKEGGFGKEAGDMV